MLFTAKKKALPCLLALVCFCLTSCADNVQPLSQAGANGQGRGEVAGAPLKSVSGVPAKLKDADPNDRVSLDEVEVIAAEADKGFADGWIDGRDSRTFKSFYKDLSPREKAQFAMAYHDMVEQSDQNLAQSYKTYIPYRVRVKFARNYWENSPRGEKFKHEIEKMQVAWIHESLLDGSELWWRAAEKHFGDAIDSPTQMAHDVEQNMVSKYMEDENTESTFSQQMTDKSKKH